MYIQRYLPHLPAAGEVVIFDRSWYNRAGVERVMGFCTDKQVANFLSVGAPLLERAIVEPHERRRARVAQAVQQVGSGVWQGVGGRIGKPGGKRWGIKARPILSRIALQDVADTVHHAAVVITLAELDRELSREILLGFIE